MVELKFDMGRQKCNLIGGSTELFCFSPPMKQRQNYTRRKKKHDRQKGKENTIIFEAMFQLTNIINK